MITKSELKYYSSLLRKKDRDEQKKFLVEGSKLILEAINSNFGCELILCVQDFLIENEKIFDEFSKKVMRIEVVSKKDFQKVQSTVSSQGVIGVFTKKRDEFSNKSAKGNLIAALEDINDPGNVGTIIRNADWFGVKEILINENCADMYNPKTIRASAGSIFHLKILVIENLIKSLTYYRSNSYQILCADINGTNIYSYQPSGKTIIVFSNEANGPSNNLINLAALKVTIPRRGNAESLNVASASAVILSELMRNQK